MLCIITLSCGFFAHVPDSISYGSTVGLCEKVFCHSIKQKRIASGHGFSDPDITFVIGFLTVCTLGI
jgi:hypothetical protein